MITDGILAIFALTYVGMAIGRIPGLRTDRAGLALVAAVLMIVITGANLRRAVEWVEICGVPALIGLGVIQAVVCWQWRGRWQLPEVPEFAAAAKAPDLHRWSLIKAILVIAALLIAFGVGAPRDLAALFAAVLFMGSRPRRHPHHDADLGDGGPVAVAHRHSAAVNEGLGRRVRGLRPSPLEHGDETSGLRARVVLRPCFVAHEIARLE